MDVDRARDADRMELPIHFEGVVLRGWLRPVALAAGLALAASGILLAVRWDGSRLELIGVLVALAGVAAVFGGVRCGRVEITVNARWVAMDIGPFRRRVPVGFVAGAAAVPARSWRRLYAAHEVEVDLTHGGGALRVPSARPEELLAAISLARGEESSGSSQD